MAERIIHICDICKSEAKRGYFNTKRRFSYESFSIAFPVYDNKLTLCKQCWDKLNNFIRNMAVKT